MCASKTPSLSTGTPGIVADMEAEPRSYLVKHACGAIYRCNRKHIRTTGETFNFNRDVADDVPAPEAHVDIPAPISTLLNQSMTPPIYDDPY